MGVLIIIISRSEGLINNLSDLAKFLKNNVYITNYEITEKGFLGFGGKQYKTKRFALYSACKAVLKPAFNLSGSEAEDAMDLLHDSGFIYVSSYDTWINGRGADKFVGFKV